MKHLPQLTDDSPPRTYLYATIRGGLAGLVLGAIGAVTGEAHHTYDGSEELTLTA